MAEHLASDAPQETMVDDHIEDFLCALGVDAFWDTRTYRTARQTRVRQPREELQEGHSTFVIRFHGASHRDPGPCGAAYVIYKKEDNSSPQKVCAGKRRVSLRSTALEAQYFGMIFGLERALEFSARVSLS
jgi:hypothetical protein